MAIDFDEINGGFEFTEEDTVSREDLENIIKKIYDYEDKIGTTTSLYRYYTTKFDQILPNKSTQKDTPLKINTEYFLGVLKEAVFTFPKVTNSETIFIQFVSGDNPTKLTIENETLWNFAPLRNKVCEIFAFSGVKADGNWGWFLTARQYDAVISE